MKRLTIYLFFAVIFCITTVLSAQAQTKEETITWLKEKLQKYTYISSFNWTGSDLSVKVNECAITFQFTLKDSKGTWTGQYVIVPTTGASIGSTIGTKNNIQSIKKKFASDEEILTNYSNISITNGEENLYERIQKAVDHLATFCPKKEETF